MDEWPHSKEWLDQQYGELESYGINPSDFELEAIGSPVNPGGFQHFCPGCGSSRTTFGTSLKRENRWVCTHCGLIFDLADPIE